MLNNNTLLQVLDNRALKARRAELEDMNRYRQTHQRPELRREYHLSLPTPSLPVLEDPSLAPVSGLQGFAGEDVRAKERMKHQKEQIKIWTMERLNEKKKEKQKEDEEKRAEMDYLKALTQKQTELEQETARMRSEQAQQDAKLNQFLANQKHDDQVHAKRTEAEIDAREVIKGKNDFLSRFEASEDAIASYKGMTAEQRAKIFDEQARQREHSLQRREKEVEENAQWARQEAAHGRLAVLLAQEQERAKKSVLRKVREENERLGAEAKLRAQDSKKEQFMKAPTESFFQQFNMSSR